MLVNFTDINSNAVFMTAAKAASPHLVLINGSRPTRASKKCAIPEQLVTVYFRASSRRLMLIEYRYSIVGDQRGRSITMLLRDISYICILFEWRDVFPVSPGE
jgi:hypothetical protein